MFFFFFSLLRRCRKPKGRVFLLLSLSDDEKRTRRVSIADERIVLAFQGCPLLMLFESNLTALSLITLHKTKMMLFALARLNKKPLVPYGGRRRSKLYLIVYTVPT